MESIEFRGRIFDGVSDEIYPGSVTIDTSTGRIDHVGKGDGGSRSASAGVSVERTDGLIMPGMVDAHIHFTGARHYNLLEWVELPPVLSAIRCTNDMRRLVEAGFTSVRDLGSKTGPFLRQAVEEGDIAGPNVVTSGRSLAETGGDDDPRVFENDIAERLSYSIYCDGPWECRKAVRQVVRDGANVVKVYASGSFIQGTKVRPQLSEEEIKAIVMEAHKMGIRVAAHAYGEEPLQLAVECGVDSIEHGIGLTEDTCELMLKKGTFYVPTLSVFMVSRNTASGEKARMIDSHLTKDMRLAVNSGIPIAAGTDFAGVDTEPHGLNHLEMVHLSKAGLKPVEVLRAATSTGAKCLGLERTGIIEEGAIADIISVLGSPEKSATSLAPENVEHVFWHGKRIR